MDFRNVENRLLVMGGGRAPFELGELWALLQFVCPQLFSWVDPEYFEGMGREEMGKIVVKLHDVLRPFLLLRRKNASIGGAGGDGDGGGGGGGGGDGGNETTPTPPLDTTPTPPPDATPPPADGDDEAAPLVGCRVATYGLSRAAMNGKAGTAVSFDQETKRVSTTTPTPQKPSPPLTHAPRL